MMTAAEMARKSWEVRKSPQEFERLKQISKLGVEKRRQNRLNEQNQG